jgi:NADPH:quinone reductase-like Zn-dependent oxidoreductase
MKIWMTSGDGIDALRVDEVPAPRPSDGEVLLEMRAWSANYRDLLVIGGDSSWRPDRPITPISDGVGVITAVGEGVTRIRPGDRVSAMFLPHWRSGPLTRATYHSPTGGPIAPGVLADYVVVAEDHVQRVPQTLTDEEAATLPIAALTAWHAVAERCKVGKGDRVLIYGTGGVALFALQFAIALGCEVMVSTSSAEKVKRVSAIGAARAVDRTTTPDIAHAALDWTDGRGVDHVIETIGGENLNQSLRALAIGGSIAFIGLIAGLSAPVNTYDFVTKNAELHGIETGSAQMYRNMARFIDDHGLKPVIDSVQPVAELAEVRSALHRLASGDHFGKLVFSAMTSTPGS